MAAAPFQFYVLLSLSLLSTHFTPIHGLFSEQSNIMLPTDQPRTEKSIHLHFFSHEIIHGDNATVIPIIIPTTPSGFGATYMQDNPLTEEKEITSTPVGRAQGLYGLASLHGSGMVTLVNFVFTEGDYKGSTLSILGRNDIFENGRELPIVGGTGAFKFAKGIDTLRTLWDISTTAYHVVEHNLRFTVKND
ncbi:hypothetical protein RIF29_38203 [Crotalaria pallida]|uniref:Dirigent protein n=1 Tax=Crotalaria pallida TaxID=3830 RepID=A0AAN9HS50_CROPI